MADGHRGLNLRVDRPAPGLVVHQPSRGFRYGLDAFCLAGFALEGGRADRFVDLGCGSGIVLLLLARLGLQGIGVEVQREWVELAQLSIAASTVAGRASVVLADARTWSPDPAPDLVVCNPPYHIPARGPTPADPWKAASRHELHGSAGDLVARAARWAPRVCAVMRADREGDLVRAMEVAGSGVTRIVRLDDALVLVESVTGHHGAPAIEHLTGRARQERVRSWYVRLGAHLQV